jgi:hypothetical protein
MASRWHISGGEQPDISLNNGVKAAFGIYESSIEGRLNIHPHGGLRPEHFSTIMFGIQAKLEMFSGDHIDINGNNKFLSDALMHCVALNGKEHLDDVYCCLVSIPESGHAEIRSRVPFRRSNKNESLQDNSLGVYAYSETNKEHNLRRLENRYMQLATDVSCFALGPMCVLHVFRDKVLHLVNNFGDALAYYDGNTLNNRVVVQGAFSYTLGVLRDEERRMRLLTNPPYEIVVPKGFLVAFKERIYDVPFGFGEQGS